MMAASVFPTCINLLERLRLDGDDQSAWEEFVARYAPVIRDWCRRWQLQDSDAEDVTQLVLIKVTARLRTFVYDPARNFRGWLRTLARHVLCDFLAEKRRRAGNNAEGLLRLQEAPARDDLASSPGEAFDMELVERAMAHVRRRVRPATWEAFRLTALEGLGGAEAAAQVGMQVATVYVARSNVLKLLRQQISRLMDRPRCA
jgi:RNA polymerase sigma-70 factor (ECF subfamily)